MKKTIVIGVTGGIACYKTVDLCSKLTKLNYDVHVIMTKNATEFVTPLTFQTITNNKVNVDTFDNNYHYDVNHISIAKKADLFLIAPCSANVLGKIVHGLCDDLLTTTFLACNCPKIIAPAMNTNMYENAITQDNLKLCQKYHIDIIEPATGMLACKDIGKGKLADIDEIIDVIEYTLTPKILKGIKVMVSAGPTIEPIDPVRFITNHSSGKMGFAIAKMAAYMGADVLMVKGDIAYSNKYVKEIKVKTAAQMFEAFKDNFQAYDFIIKAAAVADYRVKDVAINKIKKQASNLDLSLEPTVDILAYIGEHKLANQIICGFAMESENLIANAQDKLVRKNVDMIIANDISQPNAGFKVDTNIATIIEKQAISELPCMTKDELAKVILETMLKRRNNVINN